MTSERFGRRFLNALRGIVIIYRHEPSFRIQVAIMAVVVGLGFFLRVSRSEWIVLIFASIAVLILEMVNSVFERLSDAFRPRIHPIVADVKDIMAGSVLMVSLGAAIIGLVIFLPHLFLLFGWSFQGILP